MSTHNHTTMDDEVYADKLCNDIPADMWSFIVNGVLTMSLAICGISGYIYLLLTRYKQKRYICDCINGLRASFIVTIIRYGCRDDATINT
jgi:hypothetical protein